MRSVVQVAGVVGRVGRRQRTRARPVLLAAAAATGALAAWAVLGTGALVLTAAFLLATGCGRCLPALHGPAAWASGVVLAYGFVVAGSAVTALVAPHEHGQAVDLAVLAAPNLLGVALLAVGMRRAGPPREDASGLGAPAAAVPALAVAGVLVAALVVALSGDHHGIAWAMSGDARNHVAISRGIVAAGGLTEAELLATPAAVNALIAVLAGAAGRSGAAGQLIAQDVHALASASVLAAVATAVLLAAAVLELVPGSRSPRGRVRWPVAVVALGAAAATGSPLVLGYAARDGFVSAFATLPLALAAVVLVLRLVAEPSAWAPAVVLLLLTVPLAFVSWTVLAVVPLVLLALAVVVTSARRLVPALRTGADTGARVPRGGRWTAVWSWALLGLAVAEMVAVTVVVWAVRRRLVDQLSMPGGAQETNALLVLALGAGAVAVGIASSRRAVRWGALVPVAVSVVGLLTVHWLRGLPAGPPSWTYYALKTNWLVSATLVWLPFVPLALWVRDAVGADAARAARPLWRVGASAAAGSASVLLLVGSLTSAPAPLPLALRGWDQPTADAAGVALDAADLGEPYVLWRWSDPGNDRLGNFWAALAWGTDRAGRWTGLPGYPAGVAQWAYEAGSETSDLCALGEASPGLTVYTRDQSLGGEVDGTCPTAGMHVVVGPPDRAAEGSR